MNKKLIAITLLFMAFVGFSIAGAVSALPNTVPSPFTPNNKYTLFDQGNKLYDNKENNPFDDQIIVYKAYNTKLTRDKNGRQNIDVAIFYRIAKRIEIDDPPFNGWYLTLYCTTYLTRVGNDMRINVANYDRSGKKVKEWKKTITNKDTKKLTPYGYYKKYKNSLITR